jgi:hypothetical protein
MQHFSVICINDSNRPDGIPANKWPKKGQTYTVIQVDKMRIMGGVLGFKLAEINIDDCFPYQYFMASRFGIPIAGQDWAEARLLKEAKEEAVEEPQLI